MSYVDLKPPRESSSPSTIAEPTRVPGNSDSFQDSLKLLAPTELQKRLKRGVSTQELIEELGKFHARTRREKLTLLTAAKLSGDPALAVSMASLRDGLDKPGDPWGRLLSSVYLRMAGSLLASPKWDSMGSEGGTPGGKVDLAKAYLGALAELIRVGGNEIEESQWHAYAETHKWIRSRWPMFHNTPELALARDDAADAAATFLRSGVDDPSALGYARGGFLRLAGAIGNAETSESLIRWADGIDAHMAGLDSTKGRPGKAWVQLSCIRSGVILCGTTAQRESLIRVLLARLGGIESDPDGRVSTWTDIRVLLCIGMSESIGNDILTLVRDEQDRTLKDRVQSELQAAHLIR